MLTIWVLTDGKRGHENQSLGLADALTRTTQTEVIIIPVTKSLAWLANRVFGRFPPGQDKPKPDLIISAGHGTHCALLAARRAVGGKAIVLMKPSLPISWFDRAILPRHDGLSAADNRIITDGPLNRIQPQANVARTESLMLIGGPSPHFKWDSQIVIQQIREVLEHDSSRQWILTTSRRTPADFLPALESLHLRNLTIAPHEQTRADWLPEKLIRAERAWVTPDSASMVYEALTAGAGVGLFILPAQQTRVAASVLTLLDKKLVTSFTQWHHESRPLEPASHFNEADRVAHEILEWLKEN